METILFWLIRTLHEAEAGVSLGICQVSVSVENTNVGCNEQKMTWTGGGNTGQGRQKHPKKHWQGKTGQARQRINPTGEIQKTSNNEFRREQNHDGEEAQKRVLIRPAASSPTARLQRSRLPAHVTHYVGSVTKDPINKSRVATKKN